MAVIETRRRWRGILALCGGVLVHLALGTSYTFGNMAPYITSYIRDRSKPSGLTYQKAVWIYAANMVAHALTMFFGGVLDKRIGPRKTALLGGFIVSAGVSLTYLSIKSSFYLVIVTYGMMFGAGNGLAYMAPLACAMRWFPEKKGVACGCIVAGFGGGAFIFNFVQTSFINPNNLSPTVEENGEQYFGSDEVEVLDRTPYCFLLLGGCYIVMQIIGSLLLVDPQYHGKVIEEEEKLLVSINSEPEDIRWSGITIRRKEMLKTRAFWTLWLTFMANTQTSVLVATLYKAFGQTFISNDRLLSIVGSFASVCNCFGRIVWGHLADKFCFRDAMMLLCALNAAFLFTIVAVPEAGEVMFFIWVCSIFFMFSGNFSLFPTATARAFGKDYVGENYGLLFTSLIVASLIGTLSSSILSDVIGWTGIFFYCAGFSVFGLILTFTFNVKTPTGQHI